MSNIPNTTQVPNLLFNGEMAKMKDTELRVVLIVTRKTLGWIADPETGMRKEEDWISHRQLLHLTNRASRAVSAAIDSSIKRGWIEARNEKGELLDTKEKRRYIGRGGRIYYRLGKIFLSKAEGLSKGKTKEEKHSKKERAKRKELKGKTTKETVLQNKLNNKSMSAKPTDWQLKEETEKLLKDPRRHIQVIGLWIKEADLRPENAEQIQSIIHRNLRPARLLSGYTNEDIHETVKVIKNTDYLKKFTLETIAKYIDEVVAQKKKQGRRIIKYEEIRKPDGSVVMRPIYEKTKP